MYVKDLQNLQSYAASNPEYSAMLEELFRVVKRKKESSGMRPDEVPIDSGVTDKQKVYVRMISTNNTKTNFVKL